MSNEELVMPLTTQHQVSAWPPASLLFFLYAFIACLNFYTCNQTSQISWLLLKLLYIFKGNILCRNSCLVYNKDKLMTSRKNSFSDLTVSPLPAFLHPTFTQSIIVSFGLSELHIVQQRHCPSMLSYNYCYNPLIYDHKTSPMKIDAVGKQIGLWSREQGRVDTR